MKLSKSYPYRDLANLLDLPYATVLALADCLADKGHGPQCKTARQYVKTTLTLPKMHVLAAALIHIQADGECTIPDDTIKAMNEYVGPTYANLKPEKRKKVSDDNDLDFTIIIVG